MRGLILVLVMALVSCAAPNLSIQSWHSEDFEFSKNDKIFVLAPDEPSTAKLRWISLVKEELVSQGFTIVDSILYADKALEFRFTKNVYISTKDLRFVRTFQVGALEPVHDTIDIGSSSLSLSIYDAEMIRQGKRYHIWGGHLCTENEFLNEVPRQLLTLILDSYGKSIRELRTFKPAKEQD